MWTKSIYRICWKWCSFTWRRRPSRRSVFANVVSKHGRWDCSSFVGNGNGANRAGRHRPSVLKVRNFNQVYFPSCKFLCWVIIINSMFSQNESPCSHIHLRNFLLVCWNIVSKAQKYFHRDLHLREWRGSHSKWKCLRGYLWMPLFIHRNCRATGRLILRKGVAVWKYSLI
jgi:hypothetical protein